MNLLYIHGLESTEPISDEKRDALLQNGGTTIIAPKMNYHNNSNIFMELTQNHSAGNFDLIIGSSMGGFMAYYLSLFWEKPCLAFNPALAHRNVAQNLPDGILDLKRKKTIQIVMGAQDDIVDPKTTLYFLEQRITAEEPAFVHLRNDMAHRVPVTVLKEEFGLFLNRLDNNSTK